MMSVSMFVYGQGLGMMSGHDVWAGQRTCLGMMSGHDVWE